MRTIFLQRCCGALLAALSLAFVPVHAQTFPNKNIEVVVHTGAGGGSDLFEIGRAHV